MGLLLFGFMVGLLTGIGLLFLCAWLIVRAGNKTAAALVLQAAAFTLAGKRRTQPVERAESISAAQRPQTVIEHERTGLPDSHHWRPPEHQGAVPRGTVNKPLRGENPR